jgi:hypothetical protein
VAILYTRIKKATTTTADNRLLAAASVLGISMSYPNQFNRPTKGTDRKEDPKGYI